MDVVELIRNAGVVGAGGAGFPTHVKVKCQAEVVIANGAECEPLLRIDQQLMEHYPDAIVRGIQAVMEATGAKRGVVALKAHYYRAVDAMEKAIAGKPGLSLHLMKSYYPAGDEQQMVYDVTGRVVPTGGLPLDVGAVVNNVNTFLNIADALAGKPVTDKYVTVGGEVADPVTLKAPIGTPLRALIAAAGGPANAHGYTLIIGGPAMGKLESDWDAPVTKTTGGVLVFRSSHKLIAQKTGSTEDEIRMAKAVCCQCNMCTLMCPRNALGLKVEPHKAMRAAAMGQGALLGDPNGVFSCCDCGICTYYACNFGLKPARMMQNMKQELMKSGYKPRKEVKGTPNNNLEASRLPVKRLIARLGVADYDVPAPLDERDLGIRAVTIPLQQHIGAPSMPVVSVGDRVEKGALIADIRENCLGAKNHASISGSVVSVTDQAIVIEA
jgi:Na+-translocating ferredoxin:NAD+ oxidoreductase RnfC subunit